MGIPLTAQFNLNSKLPLDSRLVVQNLTDIPSASRYDGMVVYQMQDSLFYKLIDGVFLPLTKELNDLIALLQTTKADISYVQSQIQNMSSTVQGFYSTQSALTTAFPTGNSNNYVVETDNHIYRWNGSAWSDTGYTYNSLLLADNSIADTKFMNNSISYLRLKYPMAFIVENGCITVNKQTNIIHVSSGYHFITDGSLTTFPSNFDLDISTLNYATGTIICYYDKTDSTVKVAQLGSENTNSKVVLFYLYQSYIFATNRESIQQLDTNGQIYSRFGTNAIGYNNLTPTQSKYPLCYPVQDNLITINQQANTVSFATGHLLLGQTLTPVSASNNLSIAGLNYATNTVAIYYDYNDSTIKASEINVLPDVRKNILCYFYQTNVMCLNRRAIKMIGSDGYERSQSLTNYVGTNVATFVGQDFINFDFVANTITIPNGYVMLKDTYYAPAPNGTTLTITNTTDGISGLYYNITTGAFIVSHYADRATTGILGNVNIVLIASFWRNKGTVSGASIFKVGGRFLDNGANPSPMDWTNNRFLIPDKLYLVKNIPYSIYAQNFNYQNFTDDDGLLFEMDTPSCVQSFENSCNIVAPVVGTFSTQMVGIQNKVLTTALAKSFDFVVSDTAKSNTTPKILAIGDSITNRNIPYLLKWWLQQWGINPTMIGTMQNGDGAFPATNGEGREGWRWTDYCNTTLAGTGGGNPTIASTLNSVTSNPFINPSTGLFDFTYYMTQQGYSGVDFITIMLGTNDINNYTRFGGATNLTITQIIQNMKDSFNTMKTSIFAYNPNIKIGLIPPIPAGIQNTAFRTKQTQFIEEELNEFKSVSNVYLLSNFLSTGVLSGKYGDDGGTVYSSLNSTRRVSLSGDVHDIPYNERINALWSASWIMNMLT